MEFLALLKTHVSTDLRRLFLMTALAGMGTTTVLAIVNEAASQVGSDDGPSMRLAMMFLAAIGIYVVAQKWVMAVSAKEVETIVGKVRHWIFEDTRAADLHAIERMGTAPIFAGLTQETQTISRNLPIMVVGAQQVTMLVFVSGYMAILSFEAFCIAISFAMLATVVHIRRMAVHNARTQQAHVEEAKVFDGLGHLLDGFKEVRMSRTRSEGLMGDLRAASGASRDIKSAIKSGYAFELVLFQMAFYMLLALLVFVVPLFTEDFHDVIVPASTAALFMIGPVGVVAQAIPMFSDSDQAVRNVQKLRASLKEVLAASEDETTLPLEEPLQSVALDEARYAYRDGRGQVGFSIGPLSATFQAGQITFVTGGNGSGKSTMMRLLTGLARPEDGVLRVNGAPLEPGRRQAYRDRIGAIFSDFHLFRRVYGQDVDTDQVNDLLEMFGLTGKTSFSDGAFSSIRLSTGQRKRLALIQLMLEDKDMVVLDEWAADQDPIFRKRFYEELLPELKARNKIVVCVTHDDRWFPLADQVLHMDYGLFAETGWEGEHVGEKNSSDSDHTHS